MFNAGDRVFVPDDSFVATAKVPFNWYGTVTTGVPRDKDGKIAVKWDVSGPLWNDPATLTRVED